MTQNTTHIRLGAAVLSMSLLTPAAAGQINEFELHVLHVGAQRSAVIALLGSPTGSSEALTFGIPNAKLRWVIGSRVYVASFVATRLIAIRVCQSMADC